MKAQHGNGRGGRSPFITSYALTLAFITFVSVLYFKDFSSTLHQPFLRRPPSHRRGGHSEAAHSAPPAMPLLGRASTAGASSICGGSGAGRV
jgi:hypothetical protein